MNIFDKCSLLFLFIFSRTWLAFFSGNPVGVDAWDYMSWVEISADSGWLNHAPLHVPGFYAILTLLSVYTGIEIIAMYVYIFPILGAIALWKTLNPLISEYRWGMYFAAVYGFFVIRTSMIIPELLGLIMIPSAILALSLYESAITRNQRISYGVVLILLSLTTLLSHHLSGGVLLLIFLSYSTYHRDWTLLLLSFILTQVSLYFWYMAGSFPLDLISLLIKISYPLLLIGMAIIWLYTKTSHNLTFQGFNRIYSKYICIILMILLLAFFVFISKSTEISWMTLFYWSPALVIIPVSLVGIQNAKERKDFPKDLQVAWSGSIFLLILFLSIFPVVRPIISRLIVFEIQSLIPLFALGMGIIIEQSYEKEKFKTSSIIIIGLLLSLTLFHSYPNPDAWFRTEFRYYDEEIEIATLSGYWLPPDVILDSDDRIGVMFKGVSNRESTYGEYEDSWLSRYLTDNDFREIPSNISILITFVIIETGYLIGKFIHGEDRGASDVSLLFDVSILDFLNKYLSKPMISGECALWVNY